MNLLPRAHPIFMVHFYGTTLQRTFKAHCLGKTCRGASGKEAESPFQNPLPLLNPATARAPRRLGSKEAFLPAKSMALLLVNRRRVPWRCGLRWLTVSEG